MRKISTYKNFHIHPIRKISRLLHLSYVTAPAACGFHFHRQTRVLHFLCPFILVGSRQTHSNYNIYGAKIALEKATHYPDKRWKSSLYKPRSVVPLSDKISKNMHHRWSICCTNTWIGGLFTVPNQYSEQTVKILPFDAKTLLQNQKINSVQHRNQRRARKLISQLSLPSEAEAAWATWPNGDQRHCTEGNLPPGLAAASAHLLSLRWRVPRVRWHVVPSHKSDLFNNYF
jgi:hypothetical protein